MLIGAGILWLLQLAQSTSSSLGLIAPAHAITQVSTINKGDLDNCEIFFTDDREFFETEINKRIKRTKLMQSNVIWADSMKQLGYYAMICY